MVESSTPQLAPSSMGAPSSVGSPLKVGLLWHSLTSGNLGVGALTLANVALLREIAAELDINLDLTVLGMRDGDTAPILDDVDSFAIDSRRLVAPSGLRREMSGMDIVFDIGGGDSFAEIYGPKRFFFLCYSKYLALKLGKPLILSPQTIGPFEKAAYRIPAAAIMNRAQAVLARDGQSLDVLKKIAPRAPADLAVDVAFILPFTNRKTKLENRKIRVGINASGLLCTQSETGENRFGLSFDYAALHRRLIAAFCAMPDVDVHLVPHATSKKLAHDDDGHRADLLAKEFPETIRVPDFAGPSEAKSYISSLDFLVAGRMHACIGAFSAGTPVVPISYSRKFSGLFGMLEYPWMTPVKGMDEEAAFDFVMDAFQQRTRLSEDMTAGMTKVQDKLDIYRNVIRRELRAAMARQSA